HSSTDTSGSSSASADSGHSHGSTTGDVVHSHSTHQSSSVTSTHTTNSHERYINRDAHVVDHEHLREALRVHPGHEERVHAFERSHEERARFERHVATIHFLPGHRVA